MTAVAHVRVIVRAKHSVPTLVRIESNGIICCKSVIIANTSNWHDCIFFLLIQHFPCKMPEDIEVNLHYQPL